MGHDLDSQQVQHIRAIMKGAWRNDPVQDEQAVLNTDNWKFMILAKSQLDWHRGNRFWHRFKASAKLLTHRDERKFDSRTGKGVFGVRGRYLTN